MSIYHLFMKFYTCMHVQTRAKSETEVNNCTQTVYSLNIFIFLIKITFITVTVVQPIIIIWNMSATIITLENWRTSYPPFLNKLRNKVFIFPPRNHFLKAFIHTVLAITGSQRSLKARSLRLALMWIFIAWYLGRHLVVIPFRSGSSTKWAGYQYFPVH